MPTNLTTRQTEPRALLLEALTDAVLPFAWPTTTDDPTLLVREKAYAIATDAALLTRFLTIAESGADVARMTESDMCHVAIVLEKMKRALSIQYSDSDSDSDSDVLRRSDKLKRRVAVMPKPTHETPSAVASEWLTSLSDTARAVLKRLVLRGTRPFASKELATCDAATIDSEVESLLGDCRFATALWNATRGVTFADAMTEAAEARVAHAVTCIVARNRADDSDHEDEEL